MVGKELANSSYGPIQNAEIKRTATAEIIEDHTRIFQHFPEKTNLDDTETVKQIALNYLETCKLQQRLPSREGFALACGLSRQWLVLFEKNHPNHPTSIFLDQLRNAFADMRIAGNERGVISDTALIFYLKNSGLPYSDRYEIEPVAPASPLDGLNATEARKRLSESIPDEE